MGHQDAGRSVHAAVICPRDTADVTIRVVGREARRLWPLAAIVVVIAVAGALVWIVWRSPHQAGLSTFGAFAVAVIVAVASLVLYLSKLRRPGAPRPLSELADSLAVAVREQWTHAALERRLLQPEPIPVQWERSSRPLAGPVAAAVGSRQFPPLPGLPAAAAGRLRGGQLQDLHAVYGGLGSGRLVIIGGPGSGKSGAAVLLILAALKYRAQLTEEERRLVPVPVLVTVHGWDPATERVGHWLAGRLQQTYPLFAGKGAWRRQPSWCGRPGSRRSWTGSMRSRKSCGRSRCGRSATRRTSGSSS